MHKSSASKRLRLEVLLLLAVLVTTAVALLAPGIAGAAASPTSLTASSLRSTVTWGKYTILTGTLMDTGSDTALGGQMVRVERSPSGSPTSWSLLAIVTTDEAAYATGQYVHVVYPKALRWYRFNFPGNDSYAATVSNSLVIRVRPALGIPKAPLAVRAGAFFRVSGSLKPHFAAGAKTVKVKGYRYSHRRWVAVRLVSATNVNSGAYTKYTVKLRFTTKGKYRFRAYTVATSAWAGATTSLSKTLVVK
ncbi:MAG: hypothetical protein WC709_10920 [Thermoleophilia bacterium]